MTSLFVKPALEPSRSAMYRFQPCQRGAAHAHCGILNQRSASRWEWLRAAAIVDDTKRVKGDRYTTNFQLRESELRTAAVARWHEPEI